MILYLLRHGIAVDRDNADISSDDERPLTPKGIKRMQREAEAIRMLGLEIEQLFTSPLVRAEQTARIVAEELYSEKEVSLTQALAPGEGFGTRLDAQSPIVILLQQRPLESAMLVGHEPDLSQLASLLLTGTLNLNLRLKKGGLCAIDVQDPANYEHNVLLWLLAPRQLRAIRG